MKRKILFIGSDPGGCASILPLFSIFNANNYSCYASNLGSMLNVANNIGANIEFLNFKNDLNKYLNWIAENDIDAVLFSTSLFDTLPLKVAEYAQINNILTISVLDNWSNFKNRFLLGDDKFFLKPDILCVMDDFAFKNSILCGFDSNKVFISGHPSFHTLIKDYSNSSSELSSLRKNTKNILFITEPVHQDQGDNSDIATYRGYTEFDVMSDLFDCLNLFFSKYIIELNIIPHPRQDINYLSKFVKNQKINFKLDFFPKFKGRSAVFESQYIIGMSSILLYEAWLLGKPVLSYQPNCRFSDLKIIGNREGVIFIENKENLFGFLDKFLSLNQENSFKNDLILHSNSCDIIFGIVNDALNKNIS